MAALTLLPWKASVGQPSGGRGNRWVKTRIYHDLSHWILDETRWDSNLLTWVILSYSSGFCQDDLCTVYSEIFMKGQASNVRVLMYELVSISFLDRAQSLVAGVGVAWMSLLLVA